MKLLIATVAASLCAAPAFAFTSAQKRNAMHHIASASAAAEICSSIEDNRQAIVMAAMAFHIDLAGPDGDEITADAIRQMNDLKDRAEESVCQAALFMYGPNGQYVKNLVKEK